MGESIRQTCTGPDIDYVGTWIDDISVDTEHKQADRAAAAVVRVFRRLHKALTADGHQVSIGKTYFVASSSVAERALKKKLGAGDPPIQTTAKDLGMELAGGRRRCTRLSSDRRRKALARLGKLKGLRIKSPRTTSRLFSMSVLASGQWGHQAQGVSPKVLRSVRLQTASIAGRVNTGSIEVALEMGGPLVQDPLVSIVTQHFKALARVLVSLRDREQLSRTWAQLSEQLRRPDRWKIVCGPLGAMVAYLLDLGIPAPTAHQWIFPAGLCPATMAGTWEANHRVSLNPLDRSQWAAIAVCLGKACELKRRETIGRQAGCSSLSQGIDTTVPRLLLKHAPRSKTSALRTAWQGAMKSRRVKADQLCPLCRKPLSPQHMSMECKWWRGRVPPPPKHWERLKTKYPYECLWARGLMPAAATRLTGYLFGSASERAQGSCEQETWSAEHLYATDASGGPHASDPRGRVVAWSVVAFSWKDGLPLQEGVMTGVLPPGTTAAEGESFAIARLCARLEDEASCVTDCRAAMAQQQNATRPWPWAQARGKERLAKLSWTRSHTTEQQHADEFGANSSWMRTVNAVADAACGEAVRDALASLPHWDPEEADDLAREVSQYLQKKVEVLLTSVERPPWEEKDDHPPQKKPATSQKVTKRQANQHRPAANGGPNKRERIKTLIATEAGGHDWAVSSENKTNMQASCRRCTLFVQQTHKQAVFDRIEAHPCLGREQPVPEGVGVHPSHHMANVGRAWICKRCFIHLWVSYEKIPPGVTTQCRPSRKEARAGGGQLAPFLPAEHRPSWLQSEQQPGKVPPRTKNSGRAKVEQTPNDPPKLHRFFAKPQPGFLRHGLGLGMGVVSPLPRVALEVDLATRQPGMEELERHGAHPPGALG